ncbi:DUF6629 family protein [Streptacidiphilus cavernicola]|uniref:DUF6629 family protein n=1 Tax=Streptacidiphilus cavernicola TaxID=3342716 RepID=A0ABV6W074_9ACTN
MCWSSTADLVAGGTVAGLGVAALTQVRRVRQLPLAALPLLLGVHQLIEALVWWGEEGRIGAGTAGAARVAWAVIAYPLLPALVPLGVLLVAPPARRALPAVFLTVGLASSAVLAYAVASGPVTAAVDGHTLRYGVGVPHGTLVGAGYLLATVGALLASGQRDIRTLGLVCGAGAAVCLTLWQTAFVSTWCALAALSSVFVLRWLVRARGWPSGPADGADRGAASPVRSVLPGGDGPSAV